MSILEFKAENLPSRGIIYPDNTIFLVKPFDYGEVQDLNSESLSAETKIDKFIKATSINTELKGYDIAYIDYIYMHLNRVSAVYGNDTLQLPMSCPVCGGSIVEKVPFTKLELNDIGEFCDLIPFKLNLSGQEFTFTFMSINKIVKWYKLLDTINKYDIYVAVKEEHDKLEKEVSKLTLENPDPVLQNKWEKLHSRYVELNARMTNKNKAKAVKYKSYGLNALLLAFLCADFETEEFDSFLEKLTSDELSAENMEYLDFIENTLGIGLKPLKTTCPHCGKMFAYSIEDNVNNVYPFRKSTNSIANKLRAMQKATSDATPTQE